MITQKLMFTFLFVSGALCTQARAETVTFFYPPEPVHATSQAYTNTYLVDCSTGEISLTLRSGEVAQLRTILYNINGVKFGVNSLQQASMNVGDVVVGPGVIRYDTSRVGDCDVPSWSNRPLMTIQVKRNDEAFTPSGAVLVPADSAGPVSVILESSTNLVTWSSALPGTYGSTDQSRYFRVRVVNQTP